jgi:hypothetical protein
LFCCVDKHDRTGLGKTAGGDRSMLAVEGARFNCPAGHSRLTARVRRWNAAGLGKQSASCAEQNAAASQHKENQRAPDRGLPVADNARSHLKEY